MAIDYPLRLFAHCIQVEAVCRSWHDSRERDMQDGWERMRMNAAITIQPHVKGKITPQKLIAFPWENRMKKAEYDDTIIPPAFLK